jgi:hypothetical protein
VAGWLTDWLTDWQAGLLTDWLADWLTDWLADWLTEHWLTDWLTDWLAGWLTGSLTGWLSTGWLTGLLTDWLTAYQVQLLSSTAEVQIFVQVWVVCNCEQFYLLLFILYNSSMKQISVWKKNDVCLCIDEEQSKGNTLWLVYKVKVKLFQCLTKHHALKWRYSSTHS